MKKKVVMDEKIFEDDEWGLRSIDDHWSQEDLLSQDGIFFLKDVVKILNLDPVKVKKKAKEVENKGKSPWVVMGLRKVWSHWIVRMTVFAPYYRKHLIPKVRKVEEQWDGNTLMEQKGLFLLTDVCRVLPFATHQLRYRAKKNPNSKRDYGVWKHPELNAFVVKMELFAPWIKSLWKL